MTLTALKTQTPAQVIWQDATPECQVGDVIRKAYAPIARVVGKEILADGRTCLIVTFPNCRDRHTEEWVVGEIAAPVAAPVVEELVEVEAPATDAPVHTAETLKTLTWNQVQKLHTALGLKATASSRTRRDYEARILADQSQPAVVTTATTDDAPPNRGDNGRGRVSATSTLTASSPVLSTAPIRQAKQDDNFISSMVKESDFEREFHDLAYLSECQLNAQLAVERTVIGSEEEAIALLHLEKINKDIEFYGRPKSEPQPSHAVAQLEKQMTELKADTLKLFKITAFHPDILSTDADEPEQPATKSVEPEGTIHWEIPQQRGTIVGKKGARRFWIQNDDIHIALNSDFIAKESKHPNVRHSQIREAIELGRQFNPMVFKLSPSFESDTKHYNGIGRIFQGSDGRWWAWASSGITGHPFSSREIACNYLEAVAQRQFPQKSIACVK